MEPTTDLVPLVPERPWCVTCDRSPRWANHPQCYGCLRDRVKPCDVVPKFAVHWDLAIAMAEVRQYVAQWEQQYPHYELVPSFQRLWEDSAAPSKYADRETSLGRKRVWARFVVQRKHPRGWKQRPTFHGIPLVFDHEWQGVSTGLVLPSVSIQEYEVTNLPVDGQTVRECAALQKDGLWPPPTSLLRLTTTPL